MKNLDILPGIAKSKQTAIFDCLVHLNAIVGKGIVSSVDHGNNSVACRILLNSRTPSTHYTTYRFSSAEVNRNIVKVTMRRRSCYAIFDEEPSSSLTKREVC